MDKNNKIVQNKVIETNTLINTMKTALGEKPLPTILEQEQTQEQT